MNKWWSLVMNLLSVIIPAIITTANSDSDSTKKGEE